MTLDPIGLAVAVLVAQQRQVADPLLGHEHVAIRQNQQAARMLQTAREQRGRETLGHAWRLPVKGKREWPIAHDGTGPWRRQVFRLDDEATAKLLVGKRSGI